MSRKTNKTKLDLTGKKFGDLIVVKDISPNTKKRKYQCRCLITGFTKNVIQSDLLSGRKTSLVKESKVATGMHNTTEYTIWEGILQRCNNQLYTYFLFG